MKLYSFFRSSAAYRARIALNLKGLSYDYIAKHLVKNNGEHRHAEYIALNPQGLIPALEHDGAVIGQSLAIIEYLDEVFPDPPLLPKSALDRAAVRAMALLIACDIHPLNNLRVLNYLKTPLHHDADTVATWYRHWISEGFVAFEQMVAKHTFNAHFCFGKSVTIADILLVPQVANARRFHTDLSQFPTLMKISAHLESLPPFAAARPEVQPDAE